jgi:DNA-binding transcriptional MerR regulator
MLHKSPEAFRTISEVAEDLDVPQHVLRFWETRFPQVKPMKRGGGRRYYRPEDVELLRGIRTLLYTDGFTIKGVQKVLREHGIRSVVEAGKPSRGRGTLKAGHDRFMDTPARLPFAEPGADMEAAPAADEEEVGLTEDQREALNGILDELLELKAMLAEKRHPLPGKGGPASTGRDGGGDSPLLARAAGDKRR